MSGDHTALECSVPIWDRFYLVRPLVVVGTVEPDGSFDFAPKHMAGPMSWDNYYGFVCCPDHGTYRNAVRTGEFTVSYPTPEQLIETSFTSGPRAADSSKPSLGAVPTTPATRVDGALLTGASIHLECELERTVDHLGPNAIVIGRVVAASIDDAALRGLDREDDHVIADTPLLSFLHPNRFTVIDESYSFPFYSGWSR